MFTMVLSPEFEVNEKIIEADFLDGRASAFERFLLDGGVNSPDLYLCRESEDYTPESVFELEARFCGAKAVRSRTA